MTKPLPRSRPRRPSSWKVDARAERKADRNATRQRRQAEIDACEALLAR
jgi:hypothetical protein